LLLLEKVEPVACSPMESRLTKISRVETRARELKKQSQSSTTPLISSRLQSPA